MPLLGIGCREGDEKRNVAAAVETALLNGYRHIDTAFSHDNEEEVGAGISAALSSGKISRSDIFVVTKLPMVGMQSGKPEAYLRRSLQLLNLEYVDLYLIQHPVGVVEEQEQHSTQNGSTNGMASGGSSAQKQRKAFARNRSISQQGEVQTANGHGDRNQDTAGVRRRRSLHMSFKHVSGGGNGADLSGRVVSMGSDKLKLDLSTDLLAVWRDMQRLVRLGLTNNIGVCNFSVRQLTKLVAAAKIPPAVLQIECHAYCQQRELRQLCRRHNIAVTALGSFGRTVVARDGEAEEVMELLQHPVVRLVALRYKRTPAQVLLRFMIQQDITVIPEATSEKNIQENGSIFNFQLDEVDMAALESLDRGELGRFLHFKDAFPGYEQHPEYPF